MTPESLAYLLRIKRVMRSGERDGRRESTAEHTLGCELLAEALLPQEPGLDRERVLRLLRHHDLIEIEAGDTDIRSDDREQQTAREKRALPTLLERLPKEMRGAVKEDHEEYLAQQTPEARYAKAIDALEPIIHWLDSVQDWPRLGFDRLSLRNYKQRHVEGFTSTRELFETIIQRVPEN